MPDKPINNILVIRLSSLGDILLATPVIRSLKQKYPAAQIDFAVKKQYKDTLLYNTSISKLHVYEKENAGKLKGEIQILNYDLVIDLQNNFRSRMLTKGLQTKIYRFKKPTIKKLLLVWFKINLLKELKTIPQRYAETAGVQLDDKGLDLYLPETVKPQLKEGKNYIGFCPGAKHFTKRWPKEYFIELGNLLNDNGFTVVNFGGKDDLEISKQISSQIGNSVDLCNDDDLIQTAADMKKCRLIICNDSGLMHTASAIGVPLIVIFGSTVKEFGFIPYRVQNLILENNSLFCRPCSHIGKKNCPKEHFKCMIDITPTTVFNHLKEFIRNL